MRIAVAALLLGFLVAGCAGGQVGVSSDGTGPPTPKTSVVLTRPIGNVVPTRSKALAQCPSASRTCRAVRISHAAPAAWAAVVIEALRPLFHDVRERRVRREGENVLVLAARPRRR